MGENNELSGIFDQFDNVEVDTSVIVNPVPKTVTPKHVVLGMFGLYGAIILMMFAGFFLAFSNLGVLMKIGLGAPTIVGKLKFLMMVVGVVISASVYGELLGEALIRVKFGNDENTANLVRKGYKMILPVVLLILSFIILPIPAAYVIIVVYWLNAFATGMSGMASGLSHIHGTFRKMTSVDATDVHLGVINQSQANEAKSKLTKQKAMMYMMLLPLAGVLKFVMEYIFDPEELLGFVMGNIGVWAMAGIMAYNLLYDDALEYLRESVGDIETKENLTGDELGAYFLQHILSRKMSLGVVLCIAFLFPVLDLWIYEIALGLLFALTWFFAAIVEDITLTSNLDNLIQGKPTTAPIFGLFMNLNADAVPVPAPLDAEEADSQNSEEE